AAQFPGEDEPRRLGFNTATVGIERGDVESQLDRVIAHPELLQSLADSYVRLHPDEPEPEEMILCGTTTQLKNGLSVGEPELTERCAWAVRSTIRRCPRIASTPMRTLPRAPRP